MQTSFPFRQSLVAAALSGLTFVGALISPGVAAAEDAGDQASAPPPAVRDAWAAPNELRGKKLVGTGQYSLNSLTPRFLVDNPDFTRNHPFDGVVLLAPLDETWARDFGDAAYSLDDLTWSTLAVPYGAVRTTIENLRSIDWAHLTDNFLSCRLSNNTDGEAWVVDLANDADWAAVEANTALSARVCREGGLKGLWLDTEQYGGYPGGQGAYPFGRDEPEVLRRRGAQWIRAVQAEFPEVIITVTFAWSPDLDAASFLFGVRPFLDGVLEGIVEPGRIVHGYENTFYYGPSSTVVP